MKKMTLALWFAGGTLCGVIPCMAWAHMTTAPIVHRDGDPPPFCPPFCPPVKK